MVYDFGPEQVRRHDSQFARRLTHRRVLARISRPSPDIPRASPVGREPVSERPAPGRKRQGTAAGGTSFLAMASAPSPTCRAAAISDSPSELTPKKRLPARPSGHAAREHNPRIPPVFQQLIAVSVAVLGGRSVCRDARHDDFGRLRLRRGGRQQQRHTAQGQRHTYRSAARGQGRSRVGITVPSGRTRRKPASAAPPRSTSRRPPSATDRRPARTGDARWRP